MEEIRCIICSGDAPRYRFEKNSRTGEPFTLVKCPVCGLEFVCPRPTIEEISRYYQDDYFTRRDDRGYNNYFSPEVRRQIERVLALNLKDLGFYSYEQSLKQERFVLDIGCAGGYSVACFKDRGWSSSGIDIAGECIRQGREQGLDLIEGDYLSAVFPEKFDLITMWATIEHLHHPGPFLEKINRDLKPGGMLYISTCRQGGLNFMKLHGKNWRYYNFPEHLYFFSKRNLTDLLKRSGFGTVACKTYGSGTGKPGSVVRKISDFLAKYAGMGDMMIIAAKKGVSCENYQGN